MNPPRAPLDDFSPELYVATLSSVAHSDGLHPAERELLEQHAQNFGISLDALPDVPEDLSTLPWATRVLVYRDAVTLSLADELTSAEERQYLADLAERMELPSETSDAIASWANDYGELLERLDTLIDETR